MNEELNQKALSLNNTTHVSEATQASRRPPCSASLTANTSLTLMRSTPWQGSSWVSTTSQALTSTGSANRNSRKPPVHYHWQARPFPAQSIHLHSSHRPICSPAQPQPVTGALPNNEGCHWHGPEGEEMKLVFSQPLPAGMTLASRASDPVAAATTLPQGDLPNSLAVSGPIGAGEKYGDSAAELAELNDQRDRWDIGKTTTGANMKTIRNQFRSGSPRRCQPFRIASPVTDAMLSLDEVRNRLNAASNRYWWDMQRGDFAHGGGDVWHGR